MNKKLKEIIEKAQHKETGAYNQFLIIPTGEKYDGFLGINGFNKMIILAGNQGQEDWFILTNYSDAFHLLNPPQGISFDCPTDLNCIRLFSDKPIEIMSVASSVLAKSASN